MTRSAARPADPRRPNVLLSLLAATVTTALVAVSIDVLRVAVSGGVSFDELYHLDHGRTFVEAYLRALWAVVAIAVSLAAWQALVVLAARALAGRLGWSSSRAFVVSATLLSAPLTVYLGVRLMSGEGIARAVPGWWPKVVAAVACTAVLAACVGVWRRWIEPAYERRPIVWRAATVGLGAALLVADQRILPGVYPLVHGVLVLGVALLLQRLLHRPGVAGRRRPGWTRLAAVALLVGLLVGVPLGLPWAERPMANLFVLRHGVFSSGALTALAEIFVRRSPSDRELAGTSASQRSVAELRAALRVGPDGPWPDVYILSVDGLNPWHTSLEGYRRDTTPFLREMARRGVFFSRAYAAGSYTYSALLALMAGASAYQGRAELLLGRFRRLGYVTVCDVPPFSPEALKQLQSDFRARCDVSVELARDDRERGRLSMLMRSTRPIFALVHLVTTHRPFRRFGGISYGDRYADRYDAALKGTDRILRRIHATVIRSRRPARFIFTSDHGHGFGWHGYRGHRRALYEDQIRIPLILVGFGHEGRRVDLPVSAVDLTATLAGGEGTSLLATLGADPPRRATEAAPIRAFHRSAAAVVEGRFKLIEDRKLGTVELFDVVADPRETRNLVTSRPELVSRLRRALAGRRPQVSSPER